MASGSTPQYHVEEINSMMTQEIIIRKLPVVLSDGEIETYKTQLPSIIEKYDRTEENKKLNTRMFNETLKEIRNESIRLRRAIVSGREYRDVECYWCPRLARRTLELIRVDTGEIVEQRPMTATEYEEFLQQSLDLNDDLVADSDT